jgi:putative copper export protein
MQKPSLETAAGNALLMALATILILSAVGANVLGNLSTRYNVSHTQVRGWKQAQHAAEAAGDIAYAAVRQSLGVTNPADRFPGWTKGRRFLHQSSHHLWRGKFESQRHR